MPCHNPRAAQCTLHVFTCIHRQCADIVIRPSGPVPPSSPSVGTHTPITLYTFSTLFCVKPPAIKCLTHYPPHSASCGALPRAHPQVARPNPQVPHARTQVPHACVQVPHPCWVLWHRRSLLLPRQGCRDVRRCGQRMPCLLLVCSNGFLVPDLPQGRHRRAAAIQQRASILRLAAGGAVCSSEWMSGRLSAISSVWHI